MKNILTLRDLKERLQATFENNEESLEAYGKHFSTQLKAYLIETNRTNLDLIGCPDGKWNNLDAKGWYRNVNEEKSNSFFLDVNRERVWVLYSILDATESDVLVNDWILNTRNLDQCWLSRKQLFLWDNKESWTRTGLGLRFSDGLSPEESAGNFSLTAWHGAGKYIPDIEGILEIAKEKFIIHSVRWQKKSNGSTAISAEWYNNGKVTINRAVDIDEVLAFIGQMANRYADSLEFATSLRDQSMGAFEIDFSQEIDLDAFSKTVVGGKGDMKLWLIETETQPDFKRFKGIDLHTWDRVFLDVGPTYTYLTIPGKGCVNAAPRIANIQGEDNAGRTSIFHDGVEIFG